MEVGTLMKQAKYQLYGKTVERYKTF